MLQFTRGRLSHNTNLKAVPFSGKGYFKKNMGHSSGENKRTVSKNIVYK